MQTEFQFPEFAVVGNTAFIAGRYSYNDMTEVKIIKVLKRQVVVERTYKKYVKGEVTEVTEQIRFSVENWGMRLKEVKAGVESYRKDELVSEAIGRKHLANKDIAARYSKLQSDTAVAGEMNPRMVTAAKAREAAHAMLALADELEAVEAEARELNAK